MTAAEAVLQVRERYEGIKLIAAVPFRKQPLWFEAEDRLLYARLLERMDRVVMVSENYHKAVTFAGMNTWCVKRIRS